MNKMKKLISLLLLLAMVIAAAGTAFAVEATENAAVPSEQRFALDGSRVVLQAFAVGGHNYVKLRDLAQVLSGTDKQFSVEWDSGRNAVVLTTGAAYVPDGSEKEHLNPAYAASVMAPSRQTVVVDGAAAADLSVYSTAGHNYFQLAELQRYLGFGLAYDANTNTVMLTGDGSTPTRMPKAAGSYQEIYERLSQPRGGGDLSEFAVEDGVAENAAADTSAEMPVPAPTAQAASGSSASDSFRQADEAETEFSGTNVQVEGIDEGDIVKTDGTYIYVLNGSYTLTIIDSAGGKPKVVSQTTVGMSEYNEGEGKRNSGYSSKSKTPREMFIDHDRLVILSEYYSDSGSYDDETGRWQWDNEHYSCVDFYDVSNPAAPKPLENLGQDGSIIGSRMQDGHIYVITRYWVWNYDEDDPESYVPVLYRSGKGSAIDADCVLICGGEGSEYVVVGDYDLKSGSLEAVRSLLGSGDEVYMSGASLYVLGSRWDTEETGTYSESVYTVTSYSNSSATQIFRFDLSGGGLELAAAGEVPGYIDSQFSADEKDGRLRIVTTRSDSSYKIYVDDTYNFHNYKWDEDVTSSGLYVLDAELNLVGSVTGLAEDEYVYSVRFDGDIAYFCTFRSVDPLFTVDLSDPTAPKVLNALKISGFSEYLHRWDDGLLLGFGREADEDSGRTKGLKLVMFDTSDKTDVKAVHTLNLPDVDYSEVLYNHKAFFIVPEKNIIGFLAEGVYYIYAYDAGSGFQQLCTFDFDDDYSWRARGLYIGDWAYIVGTNSLKTVSMTTWSSPATLDISAED